MSIFANALAAIALSVSAASGAPAPADVITTVATPNCGNYTSVLATNTSDHIENVALHRLDANGNRTLANEFDDTTVIIRTTTASDPQDDSSTLDHVMLRSDAGDPAIISLIPGQQAEIEVYGNTPDYRQFVLVESTIDSNGQASTQDVTTFEQSSPLCAR